MDKLGYDYQNIEKDYYRKVIRNKDARSRWHLSKFNFAIKQPETNITGVLDIGSGPGVFLEFFDQNIKLFGYDIAHKQLEAGKNALPDTIFTSDLDFLVTKHAQISHIFSIELIEHINKENLENIMLAISKIIKLRSKMGLETFLYFTTPNYSSLWPIIEVFVDFFTKMNYREQHISKYNPKTLKDIIKNELIKNNIKPKVIEVGTFMGFSWISKYFKSLDFILIKLLNKGHLCYLKIQA